MSRQSQAWKAHERYVAKFYEGTRILRGNDFGNSRPDVIAPSLPKFNLEGTLIIECKHSQAQPWVDIVNACTQSTTGMRPIIAYWHASKSSGSFILWSMEETGPPANGMLDWLNSAVPYEDRKIPSYIQSYLDQARQYIDWHGSKLPDPHLPLVVLAKKHSSTRVVIADYEDLYKFITERES